MNTTGYAVVMIILAGWFVWLMSRMAAFTAHGTQTLDRLGLALAGGLLVPLVLLGIFRLIDRRRG